MTVTKNYCVKTFAVTVCYSNRVDCFGHFLGFLQTAVQRLDLFLSSGITVTSQVCCLEIASLCYYHSADGGSTFLQNTGKNVSETIQHHVPKVINHENTHFLILVHSVNCVGLIA